MSKNIVLVGFMGSGKSVVGKVLSERLKMDFVDLDGVIEAREKRPITRIFQESGEPYFREVEKGLVKEFSRQNGLIIACGGGAVLDQENIDNLKDSGIMVYLKASPEAILARTRGQAHRPLLNVDNQRGRIAELLKKRQPFYAKADFTVDTSDRDVAGVCEEIIKIVRK